MNRSNVSEIHAAQFLNAGIFHAGRNFTKLIVAPETQQPHRKMHRGSVGKTYYFGAADASLGAETAASLGGGGGRRTIGRIDGPSSPASSASSVGGDAAGPRFAFAA